MRPGLIQYTRGDSNKEEEKKKGANTISGKDVEQKNGKGGDDRKEGMKKREYGAESQCLSFVESVEVLVSPALMQCI